MRITMAFVAVLMATSAFAHHSFEAEYDDKKPITLTGTVAKATVSLVNFSHDFPEDLEILLVRQIPQMDDTTGNDTLLAQVADDLLQMGGFFRIDEIRIGMRM